jgi:SAM-dependent methyltransferase
VVTQTEIDKLVWYHAIDFGNVRTAGRIPPPQPPNYTLFGIFRFLEYIDVSDLDVIDVGTMDGLMAFALKRLGARRVVATDLWDRDQFRLARRILGYEDEIEYHTHLDIREMPERFGLGGFDALVLAGVLYHLLSPLEYLIHCRQLLKRDGLLLMETCFDPASEDVALRFNMGIDPAPFAEPTTYFLPTLGALLALLRTAAFDPLSVARISGGSNRVSVLARAERPSQVRGKTAVQRMHDSYVDSPNHFAFGNLFHRLEHDEDVPSSVRYVGPESLDGEIDIFDYTPSVPYQPAVTSSDR